MNGDDLMLRAISDVQDLGKGALSLSMKVWEKLSTGWPYSMNRKLHLKMGEIELFQLSMIIWYDKKVN